MQVELLEAKTETFGPLGRRSPTHRGDECRHLARHGSGLRPAAGLRRLGHGPLLVLRHDLRPARRAAAGKASGTELISDQALLVAIEADLEASPCEGEGYRKVWALCRDIRVARKRVLRLMRENNLLWPHRCRRRGGNPHDGEIITHAPNLMWGTDGVRVFTVDDGWGWIFTAVEHWNAECVGWHVASAAIASPPCTISMGLARLYGSTSAGAARGLALRMDHGSQSVGPLHATRSSSGASSRPTPSSPSPRPTASPRVQSHAEGTDHPWSHLPQHRGAAGRRPRLRRTLQCPVDLEKNGYLQARQAWHAAISGPPGDKLVSKEFTSWMRFDPGR